MASSLDDKIYRELRSEFIDETRDHLDDMEVSLNALYSGELSDTEAIEELKRGTHTIKGLASPFGFSLLNSISHQFEDFLLSISSISTKDIIEFQKYIDTMKVCLTQSENPVQVVEAPSLKVASLPQRLSPVAGAESLKVFVISSSRTIYRKVEHELLAAGFAAEHISHALEAFGKVANEAPDIVIVSDVLDTLTGEDLVYALTAMPSTSQAAVIYMTSYDEGSPGLEAISEIAPMITLGRDIETQIERAMTNIELKCNNKQRLMG